MGRQLESSIMGDDGAKKLTHQRKNQIKQLLLVKAREDLKLEQQQKAEEKKAALASRLEPLDDLNSLSQSDLMELCRSLHAKLGKVDEARYDTGKKVEKNDTEIEELRENIEAKAGMGGKMAVFENEE